MWKLPITRILRNFWDIKAPKTEITDKVRVVQQIFYDHLSKLVKDIVNLTLNGPGHSFGVYLMNNNFTCSN